MAPMQKKMAAALAAVNAYLQEESDAAGQHLANTLQAPAIQQSAWSQSGRQDMMMMRKLIQMRTFAHLR